MGTNKKMKGGVEITKTAYMAALCYPLCLLYVEQALFLQ